jgi:FtsP/CotA-like multicopper oxidase with cupredoxin domain
VDGKPVNDPALRDIVDIPFWIGSGPYPSVKVRMDFRDPNIVGDFVYHCHILDHEDHGMMGEIRVLPPQSKEPHLIR